MIIWLLYSTSCTPGTCKYAQKQAGIIISIAGGHSIIKPSSNHLWRIASIWTRRCHQKHLAILICPDNLLGLSQARAWVWASGTPKTMAKYISKSYLNHHFLHQTLHLGVQPHVWSNPLAQLEQKHHLTTEPQTWNLSRAYHTGNWRSGESTLISLGSRPSTELSKLQEMCVPSSKHKNHILSVCWRVWSMTVPRW